MCKRKTRNRLAFFSCAAGQPAFLFERRRTLGSLRGRVGQGPPLGRAGQIRRVALRGKFSRPGVRRIRRREFPWKKQKNVLLISVSAQSARASAPPVEGVEAGTLFDMLGTQPIGANEGLGIFFIFSLATH
jgi:hypothetical protein